MRSSRPWKLLAILATVATVQARAQSMPGMDMSAPASTPPVHVVNDSVHHAMVITSGPWLLKPMAMDHDVPMMMGGMADNGANPEQLLVKFPWPGNSWLRGFKLTIMDKNGKVLPQRTMHHMEIMNFDRRQLVYTTIERLIGIGEETAAVRLPKTVGIPLDSGNTVGVFIMWNNDTDHDMDGIQLRFELTYLPGNLTPPPVSALPFKVDVNLTAGIIDAYDVPPGGSSKTHLFTVPVSGRLLGLGGHMHDHGVEMRIEDVATGKVLARVHAIHDATGNVVGVSRQLLAVKGRGVHMLAGRQYRMVAVYENNSNEVVHGVMGVLGGLYAPDHMREWPKLDRNDKEYIRDLSAFTAISARSAPPATTGSREREQR